MAEVAKAPVTPEAPRPPTANPTNRAQRTPPRDRLRGEIDKDPRMIAAKDPAKKLSVQQEIYTERSNSNKAAIASLLNNDLRLKAIMEISPDGFDNARNLAESHYATQVWGDFAVGNPGITEALGKQDPSINSAVERYKAQEIAEARRFVLEREKATGAAGPLFSSKEAWAEWIGSKPDVARFLADSNADPSISKIYDEYLNLQQSRAPTIATEAKTAAQTDPKAGLATIAESRAVDPKRSAAAKKGAATKAANRTRQAGANPNPLAEKPAMVPKAPEPSITKDSPANPTSPEDSISIKANIDDDPRVQEAMKTGVKAIVDRARDQVYQELFQTTKAQIDSDTSIQNARIANPGEPGKVDEARERITRNTLGKFAEQNPYAAGRLSSQNLEVKHAIEMYRNHRITEARRFAQERASEIISSDKGTDAAKATAQAWKEYVASEPNTARFLAQSGLEKSLTDAYAKYEAQQAVNKAALASQATTATAKEKPNASFDTIVYPSGASSPIPRGERPSSAPSNTSPTTEAYPVGANFAIPKPRERTTTEHNAQWPPKAEASTEPKTAETNKTELASQSTKDKVAIAGSEKVNADNAVEAAKIRKDSAQKIATLEQAARDANERYEAALKGLDTTPAEAPEPTSARTETAPAPSANDRLAVLGSNIVDADRAVNLAREKNASAEEIAALEQAAREARGKQTAALAERENVLLAKLRSEAQKAAKTTTSKGTEATPATTNKRVEEVLQAVGGLSKEERQAFWIRILEILAAGTLGTVSETVDSVQSTAPQNPPGPS